MTRRFVDRGGTIAGEQRTARDSRVPFQSPREIRNFSLPDGRLRRRPGFKRHVIAGEQALAKVTGAVVAERYQQIEDEKHEMFQSPLSYGLLRWHSDFQPQLATDWSMELDLVLGEKEHLVASATKFQRQLAASTTARDINTHTEGSQHVVTTVQNHELDVGLTPVAVRLTNVTGSPDINGDYQDAEITGANEITIKDLDTTGNGPYSDGEIQILQLGSDNAPNARKIRKSGVYVYDQTVLANWCDVRHPALGAFDIGINGAGASGIPQTLHQNIPLTTMAIGYNEDEIFLWMDIVDTSGQHYNLGKVDITSAIGTYNVGDVYHLAVTFDATAGPFFNIPRVTFWVNGSSVGSYDLGANETFCGLSDFINGRTEAIQRDIVLLNEFPVRGSYASTCKIGLTRHGHIVNSHAYFDGDSSALAPWCLSPPRGTMLKALRWWDKALSSAEINSNIDARLSAPFDSNLKGYWLLNDGVGLCKDQIDEKHITLHHGMPAYVTHDDLLHNIGLSMADGQHVIASFTDTDDIYIQDVVAQLKNTFGLDARGEDAGDDQSFNYQARHNFTAMAQIRTPYTWQQEINRVDGATNNQGGSAGSGGLRDYIDVVTYALYDGRARGTAQTLFDGNLNTVAQSARAYDTTIFSIEGTATNKAGESDGETRRVPIVRCVLMPNGFLSFEISKHQGGALRNKIYRINSQAALDLNTTYTVVVKQEAIADYDVFDGTRQTKGVRFSLYLQKLSDAGNSVTTETVFNETRVDDGSHKPRSSSLDHVSNYDIIVGASMVNDGWDTSVNAAENADPNLTFGPWQVPQHFMTPYQDQPGFFTFGFFRLWTQALSDSEIQRYMHSAVSKEDYIPSLVVNWEVEEISGHQLVNKCRYPFLATLGYKGWGSPEGNAGATILDPSVNKIRDKPFYPGAWAMEDGLGYMALNGSYFDYPKPIHGLAPFQSTLRQSFGLLIVSGEAAFLDDSLQGSLERLGVRNHGLLNDFVADEPWHGTVIGDRTFLTSRGGMPKVFDGRNLLVAGFKRWSGGSLLLRATSGSLSPSKWYGVRVVYFNEQNSIEHISPVATILLGSGDGGIRIYQIPPHYDPRVTSIRIYRTLAQETQEFARSSPLFPDPDGVLPNAFIPLTTLDDADADLLAAPLNLNQTPFPVCAYSASYNGKLFLAGSLIEPDAVFVSDAANPERMDTIDQKIVLEESSGDRVNGMLAAFNALFIFKANSTWRIDDLGQGQYQVIKLASVGAVSPESVQLLTIPESGRSVITFWSQHGPYLFDGHGFQYIGTPIEEPPTSGGVGAEFAWLDAESVMTLHDVRRREIVFFHRPKIVDDNGDRQTLARRSEAAVYSYRFNAWYRYTELLGTKVLTLSFTGHDLSSQVVSGKLSEAAFGYFNKHKLLLGADNGAVYEWAEGAFDGQDPDHTSDALVTGTVSSWNGGTGTLTLDAPIAPNVWAQHLWCTIRQDGTDLTMSFPVARGTDLSASTIVLDTGYFPNVALAFTPAANDLVTLWWSTASVLFPWDDLELPFVDKGIIELVTWHDQLFFYRTAIDYVETFTAWAQLADGASKRKRTQINRRAEAVKLELKTLEQDAELDSLAYLTDYTAGANKIQT